MAKTTQSIRPRKRYGHSAVSTWPRIRTLFALRPLGRIDMAKDTDTFCFTATLHQNMDRRYGHFYFKAKPVETLRPSNFTAMSENPDSGRVDMFMAVSTLWPKQCNRYGHEIATAASDLCMDLRYGRFGKSLRPPDLKGGHKTLTPRYYCTSDC